jgi:glycosyltransferase involved in cell wall biosynthesis
MTATRQRIDLHVHSKHAGRFKPFVLGALAVEESHTEPADLYRRCLERGMTMVTITDHDTIAGCLEIAHHGDHVFLSEEVSARFPEDGCIVHVLVWGITEAQHHEIQRLRGNVYELSSWLRAQGILHALAHPFSSVNQRLSQERLRRSLVLFDTLELHNGQKDPTHARLVQEVVAKVDDAMLRRWAERYELEPPPPRRWRLTAGSDDHSGYTMARAWVELDGPPRFSTLAAAIRAGTITTHAHEKTAKSMAHTAMAGTFNHFRAHAEHAPGPQTYGHVIELFSSRALPERIEDLPPVMQRLLPAALETLASTHRLVTPARALAEAHEPGVHDEIYDVVQGTLMRAFRGCVAELLSAARAASPDGIIDELPNLVRLALFNLPYYFGFRFFHGERRRAWALYEGLDVPDPLPRPQRAAVFCDTLDNIDGVSIGLYRITAEMRDAGHEVILCGARTDDGLHVEITEHAVRFPVLGRFALPGYASYELGWPSLVEVVRWLAEQAIDVVAISTPGPMGVVAMLAARLLEIPVVGQYHTDLGAFATHLLGDRTIGRIVEGFTSAFYGGLEEVAVPTAATGRRVEAGGVRPERVRVVPRGVDHERFHPRFASADFWPARGLPGRVILYVGRVSKEKNLPQLVRVFTRLHDRDPSLGLAIVGDGPWREAMQAALAGRLVAFTGVLRSDALSTAFASADMLAFPSATDTFGNVVAESLASGTPAVVSDEGGPAEIVGSDGAGLVLRAGDDDAWVAAIEQLLHRPDLLEDMRGHARARAERFTFERARQAQWTFYADRMRAHREALRVDVR